MSELVNFVSISHEFDSATEATLSLVQEVELVSRGFRVSGPLPPISRIEDRTQARKCVRLRKALRSSFADVLETYNKLSNMVKGFSEQTELEKYYDMYDISDFDISDALQGYAEAEFDDLDSLRTLKVLAARFHTSRKMLLCSLLALDANGEKPDLLRWTAAVEALQNLNKATKSAFEKLQSILSEEQCKYLISSDVTGKPLTVCSLCSTADTKVTFNTGPRALAITAAKAGVIIQRYSRLAGKASLAARRIGQGARRLTRHF